MAKTQDDNRGTRAARCFGTVAPELNGQQKHLAIHATELALEPGLQILRRYRRSLLLRLEHAHRSALEDHVHRAPRLGERGLLNVRIGITRRL
jgi:hypothetical protein